MKKIMFNDKYGLTSSVLEGRKTMTRRIAYTGEVVKPNSGYLTESNERGTCVLCDGGLIIAKSFYKVGEVVAVAQAYEDTPASGDFFEDAAFWKKYKETKGWSNKMFVRAAAMLHQIRITDIHIERLQNISEEDCFREGVDVAFQNGHAVSYYRFENSRGHYFTPREAFAGLIDKVSGKGTWASNPWVFVYEFELVK